MDAGICRVASRRKICLEQEKTVLEALMVWANFLKDKKSALGKALHYLIDLIRYLKNGRQELTNHGAERSTKPFIVGRKNWLFSNTL